MGSKLLLLVTFLLAIAQPAVARQAKLLDEDFGLQIICLESAQADNWYEVQKLNQYTLLSFGKKLSPYGLPLTQSTNEKKHLYRIVIENSPCFYEFYSTPIFLRSVWSGPATQGNIAIDGFNFPPHATEKILRPIVRQLMETCLSNENDDFYPFPLLGRGVKGGRENYCAETVRFVLSFHSVALVSIQDGFRTFDKGIHFILGHVYIDDKRIELW